MIHTFIPTLGRVDKQFAWNLLPAKVWKKATLVCPKEEVKAHQEVGRNAVACPAKGIGATRDWIMKYARDNGIKKLVMLDDDVRLQRGRKDGRITNASEAEYFEAYDWLEETLDRTAHCGWTARFLNWAKVTGEASPSRLMYCLAYNVPLVTKAKASFTKGLTQPCVMEDFNITLQLLQAGYPSIASLEWRVHPGASNSPGGCSTWRNVERQKRSAEELAKRFPNVVKTRNKVVKGWEGMNEGLVDVTVQWRKALVTK